MTTGSGDALPGSDPAGRPPRRRSIQILVWFVAAVVAAQLLNMWLQDRRLPDPPQILSNAAMLADHRAPTLGPATSDVTIYLFSDYACPSCRAMQPDLIKLIASDRNVRIVYRDWPVLTPNSVRAARLAIASVAQGRHGAFDAALMQHGGSLDDVALQGAAARAGVDWPRLLADYIQRRGAIDDLVAQSNSFAHALGFVGTPTMIVGPYLVAGRQSPERLRELLAMARGQSPH